MTDLPTADRPGQAGADYARNRAASGEVMPDSGLCLQCTRQNHGIPSLYVSAIDAWNGAVNPHPGDRNPPVGVSVWFDSTSIYGHVATHVGGGQVVTVFNEEIRQYPMASMEDIFGPYMGWADDTNAYLTNVVAPAPAPLPIGDEDMRVIYDPKTYVYALVGAGYAYTIPNQEQADVAQMVWGTAENVKSRYNWDLARSMSLVGDRA